jgi:tetratricopeptide (TPR) repeat protein
MRFYNRVWVTLVKFCLTIVLVGLNFVNGSLHENLCLVNELRSLNDVPFPDLACSSKMESSYAYASLAYRRGHIGEAEQVLKNIESDTYLSRQVLFLKGKIAYERGDWATAAGFWRIVDIGEYLLMNGRYLHAQGRYEEAAETYLMALCVRPDFFVANESLKYARGIMELDVLKDRLWMIAHNVGANTGIGQRLLGERALLSHKCKDAAGFLEESLQLKEDAGSFARLAEAYRCLDEHELAFRAYKQAVQLSPSNPNYWAGSGYLYKALGYPEKAIPYFKRAIELGGYWHIWNALAESYQEIGRADYARGICREAYKLRNSLPPCWISLEMSESD